MLSGSVFMWLDANRFKSYGPRRNLWMNEEGFVLLELELRGENPSSLDALLASLRQRKAAAAHRSKPASG
jgi:hypothetical protein